MRLARSKSTGNRLKMNAWAYTGLLSCALLFGCSRHSKQPAVQFIRVPGAGEGGPDKLDAIEGNVRGAAEGDRIVVYAKAGAIWWIQPLVIQPFTSIAKDNTWKTSTHLGTQYAALLVHPGYEPAPTMKNLPAVGNGVSAVAMTTVGAGLVIEAKKLKFSGYDWYVRHITSDRNGAISFYDPANAWTDPSGALHLRITREGGRSKCSQVTLSNHFGYGTYIFTVKNAAGFQPATALAMFTYDDLAAEHHREMDIELSRWGNPNSKNADYVVQPYSLPENKVTFDVPPGEMSHSLRWEPGVATFTTYRRSATSAVPLVLKRNVFTTGIPTPGGEAAVIDFCDFKYSQQPLRNGEEVLIERFQYLP